MKSSLRILFLPALLLVLAVWIPYLQTGHFFFVYYDDNEYVTTNAMVRQGLSWSGFCWAFASGGYAANWHPLTWLSLMTDATLFHSSPMALHLVNVCFHAASAVVLLVILRLWTGSLTAAWLAAAFWALHPLRVESVAWISERKDVLSTFLALLATWAYLKNMGVGTPARTEAELSSNRHSVWLLASTALFALAFLAKPAVVTLPFLMVLLEFTRHGRVRWRNFELSFWVALCGMLATIYVQDKGGAIRSAAAIPYTGRILNAIASVGTYVSQQVIPRHLAIFYPWRWPPANEVLFGAAVLIIILAFILHAMKQTGLLSRQPQPATPWQMPDDLPVAAGLAWFLLALGPMIGLLQVGQQAHADRFTYWPAIGLSFSLAWLLARALEKQPCWRLMLPACLVLGTLMILTGMQASVWRNTETLFRWADAVTKDNNVAKNNLGLYLCSHGRPQEGANYLMLAYHEDTKSATEGNLAWGLIIANRQKEAERVLASIGEYRENVSFLMHSGMLATSRKDYKTAEAMLQIAARSSIEHPTCWAELGYLFAAQRRWPEAFSALQRAADLDLCLDIVRLQIKHYRHLAGDKPLPSWRSLIQEPEPDTSEKMNRMFLNL